MNYRGGVNIEKICSFSAFIIGLGGGIVALFAPDDRIRILLVCIFGVIIIGFILGVIYQHFSICTYLTRPKISLKKELRNVEEAWFIWHSGSVLVSQGTTFLKNMNYRILLPKTDNIKLLDCNISKEKIEGDIKEYEKMKKDEDPDIKWYNGSCGSAIIIANPRDKRNAWIKIESYVPKLDPSYRPSIKFSRLKDRKLFAKYVSMYETLWMEAKDTRS